MSTRDQPGSSTITATITSPPTLQASSSTTINWLPARFKGKFLVTCYDLASEKMYLKKPVDWVTAYPITGEKYPAAFLAQVRMQGSGLTLSTGEYKYIHYNGKVTVKGKTIYKYTLHHCPRTADGGCATDGGTIAVSPYTIPYRSEVDISGVGDRIANDTGGGTRVHKHFPHHGFGRYHIDLYDGTHHNACLAWGKRYLGVRFLQYDAQQPNPN